MLVPHVEAVRHVGDVGEIDLRLDRLLERGPGRVERRLQLFENQELGLLADRDAGPGGMLRDSGARVETGAGVVRHLPGDEYEVVADDGRNEAGGRDGGDTR